MKPPATRRDGPGDGDGATPRGGGCRERLLRAAGAQDEAEALRERPCRGSSRARPGPGSPSLGSAPPRMSSTQPRDTGAPSPARLKCQPTPAAQQERARAPDSPG